MLALAGCSGSADDTANVDDAATASETPTSTTDAGDDATPQLDADRDAIVTTDSAADSAVPPAARCAPLPDPPAGAVAVSTTAALRDAIGKAAEGTTILLEDGTYDVASSIQVSGKRGLTIRGRPGHRDSVILKGTGARVGCPDNRVGFWLDASPNVTISEMTITDMQCHAIQVQGTGVTNLRVHRVTMLDAGQQVFKVNARISAYSDDGTVECSTVGYTATVLPAGNTYSQGIDVHSGARWKIRDNVVKNIRSTLSSGMVVAGSISLWNGSFDSIVERNVVIDCWQGIQLGGNSTASSPDTTRTGGFQHAGGIVRNNLIVRARDFGIQLARSKGARVFHNTVWTPGYSNSIETRAQGDVMGALHWIGNNLVSGVVGLRDGDSAANVTTANNLTAPGAWFVNATGGDFHLAAGAGAIDKALPLAATELSDDLEGKPRPGSSANDVGAHER